MGSKAGYLTKLPVVWHLREFLEEDQNNKIWYRKHGYKIIEKATKVITISDALKEKYKKLLHTNNLITIPNGIDVNKFYNKEHIYSKSGFVRCVCVGGLYKNKGHEVIIKAVKKIREYQDIQFCVDFIGDGEYRPQLEAMVIQNGLDDCIHFCGFHRDVVPFYERADIAIMSSYAEAFGRVTVEAMLQGLFVVGADSAATKELLKDGKFGLLFKNKDCEDLADKLMYAIKNVEWRVETAKKGQEYALANYSAEKNADAVFELYRCIFQK